MSFDRYKIFENRSLAHRLFKRHHTHFNDIYWSQRTVFTHTFSQTKTFSTEDPVKSLFSTTNDEIRNNRSLGEWGQWYSEFDNWSRMSYIVALAGYLETYIAQISTAAFESTPSLILGAGSSKIDGATFLKHNSKYDLYSHSESLTRGDWQARASAYKGFFGSCPFEDRISKLEELRKLRNDAGHTFGRDIKSMKFAQGWEVKKLSKISDKKIMGFLELVESVANSIDEHIAKEFVGQYEVIKVFHQWLPTVNGFKKQGRKVLSKEFKRHFFDLTSGVYRPSLKLIDYYYAL
ncbi:hypothetical protein AB4455_25195 [Vibrio sp. 10N.261.46.E12]|uniref:hypothetical protein n=1 Tax=unclassified Vibrio TaxID=2614977 RepID=UPI0009769DF2|nr:MULTISPECIES: hypothetical protein [unclassified Vibrio]OMO36634.1 hypothetical protein BH584_25545 [Vibrio sp. 10N.261.45.E1]PMJ32266.1 hypothetical protein BCU27_25425 [Vibrio sp. 10N.286.45.B6]PML92534.1 hypothetical protein BCT66_25285 [Vibrio sp. 10N.261.49.E11]PMM76702.1 hypothetical protein BCT48_24800 [Vibrio sp. 10N.261.46.F12]PMM89689.1 hypothetical protein BCT46_24500 [Vibrio sp. 10N.261.46.E8]